MYTLAQVEPESWKAVDLIQSAFLEMPQVELRVRHLFTPGLYTREIFMPAGVFVISRVHKKQHPYVISKGKASVWIDGVGVRVLSAPFTGITEPGTRRLLCILEDCVWTTHHVTPFTDLKEIEADIIQEREFVPTVGAMNRLMGMEIFQLLRAGVKYDLPE